MYSVSHCERGKVKNRGGCFLVPAYSVQNKRLISGCPLSQITYRFPHIEVESRQSPPEREWRRTGCRNMSRILKFGAFEVDPGVGELRKFGMRLKLGGQPMQLLVALLERPQELVTRRELQEKLWPGVFRSILTSG